MTLWSPDDVILHTCISLARRENPLVAEAVEPFSWRSAASLMSKTAFWRMMWSTQAFQALGAHGNEVFINIPNMVKILKTHQQKKPMTI